MSLLSAFQDWNRRTNRRYAEYHARTPTRRWLLRRVLPVAVLVGVVGAVAGELLYGDWQRWLWFVPVWLLIEWMTRSTSLSDGPDRWRDKPGADRRPGPGSGA